MFDPQTANDIPSPRFLPNNSVHRSSTTIPELPGCNVEISFLNHFLIKRGYSHVGCRITAIDSQGQRIKSDLKMITEAKAYTIPLTGMVEQKVETYQIEFFCADNIVIPFPAVMINHYNQQFMNSVHVCNRVYNDVFDEEQVLTNDCAESSIDVFALPDRQTFFIFTVGPYACQDNIEIELLTEHKKYHKILPIDLPRFANKHLLLTALFPDFPLGETGTIRLRQAQQTMFYQRLFTGVWHKTGAFSGNHSYYDSSEQQDYYDHNQPSFRLCPYYHDLKNSVRFYPIQSPGILQITVILYDSDGKYLKSINAGTIKSPGNCFLDININEIAQSSGLTTKTINAYSLVATPESGNTPIRIAHQLIYAYEDGLESSVCIGMRNLNLSNDKMAGLCWGQIPIGVDFDTRLSIAGIYPEKSAFTVAIAYYGPNGKICDQVLEVPAGGCLKLDVKSLLTPLITLQETQHHENYWFILRCNRHDVWSHIITFHQKYHHMTGEHSF